MAGNPVPRQALRGAAGVPALLLVLLAGAAAWFWFSYVPRERAAAIDAWSRDLDLRADIRKEALGRYFTDSFADAATLASYPTALHAVATTPGDAASRAAPGESQIGHLEELFNDFARIHAVLGVVLWDAAERPVAKSGDLVVESGCTGPAREVIAAGQPAAGFHEHPGFGPVLTFAAPVRSADGRAHGAIVVAVDPREWLYPLLSRPLAGTSSGEALLVARDGAEAVFLSPLRHIPDAPLHYRRPLDTPGFAARAALEGDETVGPYVDYRGVRVLSAGARLPPSPWALVVKVDEDEALAGFRGRMWRMAVGGAVGFLGILGVAWGVWQRRERLQVAALAESAERIRQLNRLLKTISEINQLIVRAEDPKTLLAKACHVLVEHGGFGIAWVGLVDRGAGRVVPAARAGAGAESLDEITVRFNEMPNGWGSMGTAIQTGQHAVVPDLAAEPTIAPWRDEILALGFRTTGAFPFRVRGEVAGALTVYSAEAGTIGDEETALLDELAADLGYAIETLEIRDEHRRAEEALAIQSRIAAIFATIPDEEMFNEVLKVILDVMQSPFGVFGFIDEDGANVVPTMTRQIWDKCQVPEKSIRFPRETWGDSSWPRAIREKRTICINEPSAKIPEGHVGIQRHISLPVLFRGEAIGLFQVANRETDYTEADVRSLEAIAAHVAPFLRARLLRERASEALGKLNAELENRVETRTSELESANKELEAFSYSVSHDLRAPLRAVDGFSRILLEDHAEQLDAEGKRLFGIVRASARQMGQLIDDLLSFSRLGRQKMARMDVDMEVLAKTAFRELAAAGEEVSFAVDSLPHADVDPSLMRQVFMNLVSNALKFTGPKAKRAVEVGARTEPDRIVYWVKDNGVGFDMAYADKLFGVFQRLHSSHEFEGTGVGLALVQSIVHRHGGEVWAEGKVGEGATFSFSLPRKGGPP